MAVPARGPGAARPLLRHRRRGRHHPHRRGAHAADHLRARRPTPSQQYRELKPPVEQLVRKQRDLCNRLVQEAKESAGARARTRRPQTRLYQVHQGMPKNKQLLHLLEDPADPASSWRRSRTQMLTDMRKEQARALREELFFTIDEKGHDANLTEKGCEALSPRRPGMPSCCPTSSTALAELDGDASHVRGGASSSARQELQDEFARQERDASTPSTSSSAPTASTRRTSSTSCRTTRSSSSTRTPAASCPAAAGATACTRRSRPRKASRSSARPRPWPPSRSRTTSACTRSWPA